MEIQDLKSADMLLTRYQSIQKLSELTNEVLSILVSKGAEKLFKVEGPRGVEHKMLDFFGPSALIFHSSAAP